jgi:hypothetical protein
VHVKMVTAEGKTIEWTLQQSAGKVSVKQVDPAGLLRIAFSDADIAGAWIMAQAEFFRSELGCKFVA